jgi:outer membrane protein insertion porin family
VWREFGDIRGSEIRWGAGLGLRVETPVGPLRLEYGWKLKREWLSPTLRESSGEAFLSFGNAF